jgi:hypothetical protein
MAVFSNLEGTMKKAFILGKNGAKLSYDNNALSVHNYRGTSLIPISAGEPVDGTHLITLSYFNSHSGGGSSSALRGTTDPAQSLGSDGDTYYKVDSVSILQIYVKDEGIWKPYATPTDSQYVTTTVATVSDFQQIGTDYVYTLPATTHMRGSDIIVQLQAAGGAVTGSDVQIDASGNITVTLDSQPTSDINLVIIGSTTLSTPYSKLINKSDWIASGSDFELSIPQSVHGQEAGSIFLAVYQNTIDSATSVSPYSIVAVQTSIDSTGNVILTASVAFSGKIVISGK